MLSIIAIIIQNDHKDFCKKIKYKLKPIIFRIRIGHHTSRKHNWNIYILKSVKFTLKTWNKDHCQNFEGIFQSPNPKNINLKSMFNTKSSYSIELRIKVNSEWLDLYCVSWSNLFALILFWNPLENLFFSVLTFLFA